jgi:glycosyltransferase involved in cell wall biosynthesis
MMTRDHNKDGVSLIIATLGKHDLCPLLDSLEKQTCKAYECIVIDQSKEQGIENVVSKYNNIKYIHSNHKGNSHNRNIGIDLAQMQILAFPDDDCYYNHDVIEKVLEVFRKRPEIDGISGNWMDSITRKVAMGGSKYKHVTIFNSWTSVTNITLFLRSEIVKNVHGYDEMFGLGSNVFEGGEETDFVIKIIEKEGLIIYYPDIRIWHRQENYSLNDYEKQLGYEEAWGALFRKWSFRGRGKTQVFKAIILLVFRSFVGALLWGLRGNFVNSRIYIMKNIARSRGWIRYGYIKKTLSDKYE